MTAAAGAAGYSGTPLPRGFVVVAATGRATSFVIRIPTASSSFGS